MNLHSNRLEKLLNSWPGKKVFGIYRFLPIFFLCGASLEFCMIKFRVGEVNFYNTYKKRQALNAVQRELEKSTEP